MEVVSVPCKVPGCQRWGILDSEGRCQHCAGTVGVAQYPPQLSDSDPASSGGD